MLYYPVMFLFVGFITGALNMAGIATVTTQSSWTTTFEWDHIAHDPLVDGTYRSSVLTDQICHTGSQRGRLIMSPQEQISKMKKAIVQAIKVMGDRFGSTEQDVTRAIQELRASMEGASETSRSSNTMLGQVAGHPLISKPV